MSYRASTKWSIFTKLEVQKPDTKIRLADVPEQKVRVFLQRVADAMFGSTNIPKEIWMAQYDYDPHDEFLILSAKLDFVGASDFECATKIAQKMGAELFVFDGHEKQDEYLVELSFLWKLSRQEIIQKLEVDLVDISLPYERVIFTKERVEELLAISHDVDNAIKQNVLERNAGNVEVAVMSADPLEATEFIAQMRKAGIKCAYLRRLHLDAYPQIVIWQSFFESQRGIPDLFSELGNMRIMNPMLESIAVENRYRFLRKLKDTGLKYPTTQFFDTAELLEAYLETHPDQTFAVKEHLHRGGGTTPFRLRGSLNEDQRAILRRCSFDYPLSAQEWIEHDPNTDYLRVFTLGEAQFGKAPKPGQKFKLFHAQEANGFVKAEIPKEVSEMGYKLNSFFHLDYNSTDYIRDREGAWYVIDLQAERTDTFDYFNLEKERYSDAWANYLKKALGR